MAGKKNQNKAVKSTTKQENNVENTTTENSKVIDNKNEVKDLPPQSSFPSDNENGKILPLQESFINETQIKNEEENPTSTVSVQDKPVIENVLTTETEIIPTPTFPPENEPVIENTTITEIPIIKKDEEIVISNIESVTKQENNIEKTNEIKSEKPIITSNQDKNILINIDIKRNGTLSFKGHMRISDIILKINKFEDINVYVTSIAISDILKKQLSEKQAERVFVKKK